MTSFVGAEALAELWAKTKALGISGGCIVDYVDLSTGTVGHGGNSPALTATAPAHSGYEPVAIAGWDTTGSSQRQNWFVMWRCLLDGNTVTLRVCNHHASDSAYTTYRVYILYAPAAS